MEGRLRARLSCPKGPPPDAVHMSSKVVDPEPVQNTQQNSPAAADTQNECSMCRVWGIVSRMSFDWESGSG